MCNAKWENNDIQFPRLLAEIMATQNLDMAVLAESMALTVEEVSELFDRAVEDWESIKAGVPVGLESILVDQKIGVVPDPMLGWLAHSFGDATEFSGASPLDAVARCWTASQPLPPYTWIPADGYTKDECDGAVLMATFGGAGTPFVKCDMSICEYRDGRIIPMHGTEQMEPVKTIAEAMDAIQRYWETLPDREKLSIR